MLRFNSKKVKQGDIFLCLPSAQIYAEEALSNGAEKIIHCDRKEMAEISANYFGHPSKKLTVIGITGTNGKTTTTNLVAQILSYCGYKPYIIGTLSGNLTTPESIDLQKIMSQRLKEGYSHIIMEVSSIGVDQHRVDQIDFDIKLLTNITQDHLDYHKTFENYKKAKYYFLENMPGVAILPEEYQKYVIDFALPLKGKFNYLNCQAAASICNRLGIKKEIIKEALKSCKPVPGRFESIDEGQNFYVFVDYAHTPDGLENILQGAIDFQNEHNLKGKIITTFGCGGDRDKGKRPQMGEIAARMSNITYITSDNPRTEDPDTIISDILEGINKKDSIRVEPDRRIAIRKAIQDAQKEDIIVIAGKGHEDYQIIGTQKTHFDDREEARSAIKEKIN